MDMLTMAFALRHGRAPNWAALARAVQRLPLAPIVDTDDAVFFWDDWLADAELEWPSAAGAYEILVSAQAVLLDHAACLRGALHHGFPEELVVLDTPSDWVFLTGGPSSGEDPTDLLHPMVELAESGVAEAAGFAVTPRYGGVPPAERTLSLEADDLRRVRFGVAVAHVAEQAESPRDASDPLLRAAVREFRASALAPEELAGLGDRPGGAACAPVESDADRVAPEACDGYLRAVRAVQALAEAHGDDVGALVEAELPEIGAFAPGPSERRDRPLRDHLALLWAGEHFDWSALPPGADRDELRDLLVHDAYRRYATTLDVGAARLVVAAPMGNRYGDAPDAARIIGRLARDGTLAAAGAQSWSAPAR